MAKVTIYTRAADGWVTTIYNDLTDTLPLPAIETGLPLAEIAGDEVLDNISIGNRAEKADRTGMTQVAGAS